MVFAQYFTNTMKTNESSSGTQKPSQPQNLICVRKKQNHRYDDFEIIGMMVLKNIGMMISKTIGMMVLKKNCMMILKTIGMMVLKTIGMMILRTIGMNCSYVRVLIYVLMCICLELCDSQ